MAKTGKYWGQYWLIKPISQPDLSLGTTEPGSSFIIPADWFKAGNEPQSYDAGIDKGAGQDGKNAATIKSISENINGFGNLMQNCLPDKYLGKRVRMTGYMKTQDVASWAGFWMRVDQANSKISLAFDNMHDGIQNRSITGSIPWTKYEIVLDVPVMLQVEMEFQNSYICKLKERKFQNAGEKTLHSRTEDYYSQRAA